MHDTEAELKQFVDKQEQKHKKFLFLYKCSEKLKKFGKNLLLFTCSKTTIGGKLEFCLHLFLAVCASIMFSMSMCMKMYIGLHAVIGIIGYSGCVIFGRELEQIVGDCQRILEPYLKEKYEEYGIVKCEWGDEVRFGKEVTVKSGEFCGKISFQPITMNIYCLENKEGAKQYEEDRRNGKMADLKKEITSEQFNQTYGVLVPEGQEKACMEFLSPYRQIKMMHVTDLQEMIKLQIGNGKINADMDLEFGECTENIPIYSTKPIEEIFEEGELYCKNVRQLAQETYGFYRQIADIMSEG